MTNTNSFDLKRLHGNAMTVKDLISDLEMMDPDAKVVFQSDYGDIVHTQQLLAATYVEECDHDHYEVYDSGYSHSGVAIRERDWTDEDLDDLDDPDTSKLGQNDGPALVVIS